MNSLRHLVPVAVIILHGCAPLYVPNAQQFGLCSMPNYKPSLCFRTALIVLTCIAALLAGCAPPTYIPGASQAYLFADSNQLQVAAFTGSGGYDGHLAWSPLQHVALSTAGSYLNERQDSLHYLERWYGELALWYSKNLYQHYIEAGLGGGYGDIESVGSYMSARAIATLINPLLWMGADSTDFAPTHLIFTGNYTRWFLQVSSGRINAATIGNIISVDVGSTVRATYISFSSLERNGRPVDTPNPDRWFIECTSFGRIGFSIFKVEGQFGISLPLTPEEPLCLTTAVGLRLQL